MLSAKLLIVDDHPAIAMSLRILLEREGHTVVGEADNGIDAIKLARELLPDIVILDIGIPKLNGLQVITRLLSNNKSLKIIVLTTESAANYGYRCSQAGAAGFICKNEPLNEVLSAINAVISGRGYFPMEVFDEMRMRKSNLGEENNLLSSLTNKEVVILKMLSQGKSNKSIGETLLLSNKTISTYKTRILEKLRVNNIAELIEFVKLHNL